MIFDDALKTVVWPAESLARDEWYDLELLGYRSLVTYVDPPTHDNGLIDGRAWMPAQDELDAKDWVIVGKGVAAVQPVEPLSLEARIAELEAKLAGVETDVAVLKDASAAAEAVAEAVKP